MSMFFGLRGMAYLPVESFSWGGLSWFSDLTLADPYYLLPALTSLTLYLQLHFAADGASLDQAGPIMRGVMKGLPIMLFPLTMSFPAVRPTSAQALGVLASLHLFFAGSDVLLADHQHHFSGPGPLRPPPGCPEQTGHPEDRQTRQVEAALH